MERKLASAIFASPPESSYDEALRVSPSLQSSLLLLLLLLPLFLRWVLTDLLRSRCAVLHQRRGHQGERRVPREPALDRPHLPQVRTCNTHRATHAAHALTTNRVGVLCVVFCACRAHTAAGSTTWPRPRSTTPRPPRCNPRARPTSPSSRRPSRSTPASRRACFCSLSIVLTPTTNEQQLPSSSSCSVALLLSSRRQLELTPR